MGIAFYIGVCIIAAPFLLLTLPGYWRLFEKAGRPGWQALIPFYSYYAMLKISGRPAWWLVWLIVPAFNFIIAVVIYIDFIKSYGKFSTRKQLGAIFFPYIYILKWGFDGTEYLGPYASIEFQEKNEKAAARPAIVDWGIALICLAGFVIFVRTFIIETYVATSAAMERSLLAGDCFFVSKLNYGARLPITPVSIPLVNSRVPQTNIKTYWDGIKLPYLRLPGFNGVKRGDIVVFNYPMDTDSAYYRPVDKREAFIKRCIGLPGDVLSIINAKVYINNGKTTLPPESQTDYTITTNGTEINPALLKELHILRLEGSEFYTMTAASAEKLRGYAFIKSVVPNISAKGTSPGSAFPYQSSPDSTINVNLPEYKWNVDNYGSITIPKKGWTIKLDSITFPLYARAIELYENNTVKVVGKDILINGKKTSGYTFKMNYYWMMGDNRHDTFDSRFWGFVPEDHIIGKVISIWMSTDSEAPLFGSIRWNRFFKGIN